MKRIIVTVHDDCYVAYAHMYPDNQSLVSLMKYIYIEYYDTINPMYLFLGRHSYVLYPKKAETLSCEEQEPPSIIKHAGIFARYKYEKLLIPEHHNMHKFEFDDKMLAHEGNNIINKLSNEKLIGQLLEAIQLYGSELYQIFVPFDVLYCDET